MQQKNMKEGVTQQLAQYVVSVDYRDLSTGVIHAAKRCLLDWLGVALGGSTHRGVDILLQVSERLGTSNNAIIIGRKRRTDLLHSAVINGFMSHVLDYDDTHLESFVHPSAPVWPAIISLSGKMKVSGQQALLAFILGYEVETRIGRVLFKKHDERGWHMTGMVGGFGAAAAAGKILNLDVKKLTQAFGIAATYASGLREMFGTMTKSLHPGKAAMSGLYSALLAEAGFTSSEKVLEAPRGFFAVNASKSAIEEAAAGLGKNFEIVNNSVKPYSSGVVTHPAIDGVINIRDREKIKPQDVKAIEAEVNKMVLDVTGKKSPATGLEGKFSIYHCIAAALVDGTCGPSQFTDERVNDPVIAAVRECVSIKTSPHFRKSEARVQITLKNGKTFLEYVQFAKGTSNNPLSDEKLMEKYSNLAEKILGSNQTKKLASKVWQADEIDNFQDLILLTTPSF